MTASKEPERCAQRRDDGEPCGKGPADRVHSHAYKTSDGELTHPFQKEGKP